MKGRAIFIPTLALLLASGLFVYDGVNFEKKALARGRDIVDSVDVQKEYSFLVAKQVKKVTYEEKNAALNIKRNALIKEKQAKSTDTKLAKITYDIDVNEGEDFKETFKKSLFIGDSITHGLLYYKEVHATNVMADVGQGLKKTIKNIDKIKEKKPENIYIMLGLNDSISNITPEKYKENYADLIDKIRQVSPDSKINITSILPVDKKNKKATERVDNEKVAKMNDVLVELASEKELDFIDLRPFIENHQDFYEPDGIHVKRIFQKYWLKFIEVNYM